MSELLQRCDSRELSEWQAFDAVDPIGHMRTDYSVAMMMCMYANGNRQRGSKAHTVQEFMPFMPEKTEEEKADEQMAEFQHFADMFNARLAQQKILESVEKGKAEAAVDTDDGLQSDKKA